MPSSHSHAALILVGHGSTMNPDSSAPTLQHADDIRRRGLFAEVVCAFWKEEPSMTEVFEMVESQEVYVVPVFISEGYFCQEVLPRELRLTGPTTQRGEQTVHYCDPVGIHPNMTRLLLQRADEVAPGVPRDQTCLIIVGHGTSLNENSRKVIEQQVALIRDGGHGFAQVQDAYMEEAPLVSDWHQLTACPNVVVVPFFIADGLHSYQDIPVLLGFETEGNTAASQREVFRHNPHHLHGRQLFYSSAIGTEPHMADVILDQVQEFDKKHQPVPLPPLETGLHEWVHEKLRQSPSLVIGQVEIHATQGGYIMQPAHGDSSTVILFFDPKEARRISNLDANQQFRSLKSAPTLTDRWTLHLDSVYQVREALDIFYPGALAMAFKHEQGDLKPVPLRELLRRQTGMYRFTNTIRDDQIPGMVAKCCDSATRCMRRILWEVRPGEPLGDEALHKVVPTPQSAERVRIPLLCMEACPHLVSAARKIAQQNYAEANPPTKAAE